MAEPIPPSPSTLAQAMHVLEVYKREKAKPSTQNIYDRVASLTGVPRDKVKQYCYAEMYNTGPFAPVTHKVKPKPGAT